MLAMQILVVEMSIFGEQVSIGGLAMVLLNSR